MKGEIGYKKLINAEKWEQNDDNETLKKLSRIPGKNLFEQDGKKQITRNLNLNSLQMKSVVNYKYDKR